MNKAKRAIIMAAGFGSRMMPLTAETPKPLIRVHGVRMADRLIEGLMQNGIREIYIVVGHLKEKFEVIREKYPNVKLIENPYYGEMNNISSLYVAREHLKDCIIMEGDLVLHNPKIFHPEFARSGYCAIPEKGLTTEWLLNLNSEGVITDCSRTGGVGGWRLIGISFWTAEDGQRLCRCLEQAFAAGKTELFWDDLALFEHRDDFKLGIREIREGDIVELDSLAELAAMDTSYTTYLSRA
ncbi:MAG: NTP transferase domain-containing protein [Tissierellia bacterium]|nr:NTP transferase domain-containing protein [Tissierellia bacterium]